MRIKDVITQDESIWYFNKFSPLLQGPRSKFSSGGAKEECVNENFLGGGPGGACLWISIQFL